jgi:V/A-type H+-transporting ATPase subunit A
VIIQIAGPTVTAAGVDVALGERVAVGDAALPGEVIRIRDGRATIQVFEDAGGLALGEPVVAAGEPLMAELGPGLLGQVFDGIQRPLGRLGTFLERGATLPALDRDRRWRFEPAVAAGDRVEAGALLGTVAETASLVHRVLVPPGRAGVVTAVRAGDARVTDPVVELEAGPPLTLLQRWPVKRPRPFRARLPADVPFLTGQRVLDTLFPIAVGGAAIIPGGFGTGKTVLEQALAKFADADLIVYVGCGERGNEMTDVLAELPALRDPRTGGPLLGRTVLIVNTSNMPVAAREASIYTGVTVAEYFRDMGYRVALMADSTSRWAEALREIASRLEEMPGEEGYPTSLAARLAQFYERAGRVTTLGGREGAVTIVGAVSPPGGDFSEPVTQASLRVTGALWALSAELAHRRHFPAVDWARSFTLYADRLALAPGLAALRDEAVRLLARERELEEAAQLVGVEALPDEERAVLDAAALLREGFLRQNATSDVDASCPPAKALGMLRILLGHARRSIALGRPAGDTARLLRLAEIPPAQIDAVLAALEEELACPT